MSSYWALLGLGVSDGYRKQSGCCHGDGWWPEISFFSTSSLIFHKCSIYLYTWNKGLWSCLSVLGTNVLTMSFFWMIKPFAPWIESYTIFFGWCIWCIDHLSNNTGLLRILNDLLGSHKIKPVSQQHYIMPYSVKMLNVTSIIINH